MRRNGASRSSVRGAGWLAHGGRPRVDRVVHERVRDLVLFARDGSDRPTLEILERPQRLRMEYAQVFLLDPVLPGDLARDQLRVVHDLELSRPQRACTVNAEKK